MKITPDSSNFYLSIKINNKCMYIIKFMTIKIKVKNSQIPLDFSKKWYKI